MAQYSSWDPASKISSVIVFSNASATTSFSQLPSSKQKMQTYRLRHGPFLCRRKEQRGCLGLGFEFLWRTGIKKGAGAYGAVVFSPTRMPTLALNVDTISTITGGAHHSAAITANEQLLAWGRLDGCQLGLNLKSLPETDTIQDSKGKTRILVQPTELPNSIIGTTKFVAVGTDHNVTINTAVQAHSWGFNANYQCGHDAGSDEIDEPTRIENTAVEDRDLIWAGTGRQFSMMLK